MSYEPPDSSESARPDGGGWRTNGEGRKPDSSEWRIVSKRRFDGEDLTAAVYDALVAGDVDVDVPLYECVDLSLAEPLLFGVDRPRLEGAVTFVYRELRVSVDSDGEIRVYEPADE